MICLSSTRYISRHMSVNTPSPKIQSQFCVDCTKAQQFFRTKKSIYLLYLHSKECGHAIRLVVIFACYKTHKEDKCEGDRMCKRQWHRTAELISSRTCNLAWHYIQHATSILYLSASRDNSLDTHFHKGRQILALQGSVVYSYSFSLTQDSHHYQVSLTQVCQLSVEWDRLLCLWRLMFSGRVGKCWIVVCGFL